MYAVDELCRRLLKALVYARADPADGDVGAYTGLGHVEAGDVIRHCLNVCDPGRFNLFTG